MRQFLSSFMLLGYHLLLSFFVGSSECDLDLCKRILDEKLEKYPNGAFFQVSTCTDNEIGMNHRTNMKGRVVVRVFQVIITRPYRLNTIFYILACYFFLKKKQSHIKIGMDPP